MRFARHLIILVSILLLSGGCPRRAPVKRPLPVLNGARLTGVWMGTLRDRPALGEHREVRVLYQLQAHIATGKLTGSLAFRGALTTAYRGELLCNRKPRAELKRAADIAHGHFDSHRARWTLKEVKSDGARHCAFRFPMAQTCTALPLRSGGLGLRCGGLKLALRRVDVTGVWAWDEERVDRAGDTVVKRQRFHLVQRGTDLTGFADDIRVRVSQDGQRYRCNGRLRYAQQSRHRLTGRLSGLTIRLRVVSTIRQRGLCEGAHKLPAELVGAWKPFEDRLELPLTQGGRKLRRLPGLLPVGAPRPRSTAYSNH
jgi:hypothetical protein